MERNMQFKDFDGTLSSFYRFSPHNLFFEATPLQPLVTNTHLTSVSFISFISKVTHGKNVVMVVLIHAYILNKSAVE